MSGMGLTLYCSPGACSLACHIALEEAGAAYAIEEIAVHRGETGTPRYLAINPHGRVPALDIDGAVLTENLAILIWIADTCPHAGLMPKDMWEKARCIEFMAWIASTVHPAFARIVKPHRFCDDAGSHTALGEKAKADFWSYICEIDRMIGSGPWVTGERFGLCDANLLPFWGFARRMRLPMHEVAAFTGWKDRMIARPAVRRVLERENSLLLKSA